MNINTSNLTLKRFLIIKVNTNKYTLQEGGIQEDTHLQAANNSRHFPSNMQHMFYGSWGKVCSCACAPCHKWKRKTAKEPTVLSFSFCQMEQHTNVMSSDSSLSSASHDIRWCFDSDQRSKNPKGTWKIRGHRIHLSSCSGSIVNQKY